MRIRLRIPQVLTAVGLLALAAVATAATAQYVFDMQPCPWCVLQRFIYIVVAVVALVGAFLSNGARRAAIWLALLSALSGLAAALWQQLYAVNHCSGLYLSTGAVMKDVPGQQIEHFTWIPVTQDPAFTHVIGYRTPSAAFVGEVDTSPIRPPAYGSF